MKKLKLVKPELIDMHIHTTSSDGEYDCLVLLKKIIEEGKIKTFSFTNHDNVQDNILLEGNIPDYLNYINGCEFSATPTKEFRKPKYQLHILGYDFDSKNAMITSLLKKRHEYDIYNFNLLLDELKHSGVLFKDDDIHQIMAKPKFNRVDLAALMIKSGLTRSVQEAFDIYLNDAHNKMEPYRKIILDEEVLEAIQNAGGYVSLAHAISTKLDINDLERYLVYLKSLGLNAVEVYHPRHSEEYRKMLLEITNKHNLLVSAGSDYHGPIVKPDIELGTGKNGNVNVKEVSLAMHILSRKR